jgi:hypothetical protein
VRDAEILRLTERIRHLEASWIEMGRRLSDRDAEVAALDGRLQIVTASETALKTELATTQSESARLREAILERDASANSAAEREAGLRRQIDALYRSSSWRLTAPLRLIRNRLDRIRKKPAGRS